MTSKMSGGSQTRLQWKTPCESLVEGRRLVICGHREKCLAEELQLSQIVSNWKVETLERGFPPLTTPFHFMSMYLTTFNQTVGLYLRLFTTFVK